MDIRWWLARKFLRVRQSPRSPVAAIIEPHAETWGEGQDWALPVYGEYYAKSVPIYAAVKLLAESVSRPPVLVQTKATNGDMADVPETHPLGQLLRKVNPFWSGVDLWRATETYLQLWGSAYWWLVKSGPSSVPTEIWPVRPDNMRVIGDKKTYIKGYWYEHNGQRIPLLPDEVVWFRFFNPLNELAGLSPVAPMRLSVDMGQDALRSNRNLFKRGVLAGNLWFKADDGVGDAEVKDFEIRLAKRFSGPDNAHRPIVMSGMEPKSLGLTPKDMEHMATLRWSLEDVCRVYNIPKPMLHDIERATYSNMETAERIFWRNNIVPHLQFLQAEVNEMLCPQFGSNLQIAFDLSAIEALQENRNAVWERLRQNVNSGLMTVNEARNEMGLEELPWGDVWWAPIGLYPVSSPTSSAPIGPELAPTMEMFSANGHRRYTPPALTDAALERASAIHIKRLDRFERRLKETQTALFDKQKRDVLNRLKQTGKQGGAIPGVFDPAAWLEAFRKVGLPLFMAALRDSAQGQVDQYGLGIAFDVNRPLVQEWLQDRVKFWAGRVNEETGRLLMQELQEASQLGESIRDMQARVEKVFRFNDEIRSERIARTEMQSATNRGALEAYRQSGVVEMKMWIATLDDRVRDAHLEVHKAVVPLEAQFLVGGEMIDGPGDGSAANVINCRCALGPVISKATRSLPAPAALATGPHRVMKHIKRDANGFPSEIEEITE